MAVRRRQQVMRALKWGGLTGAVAVLALMVASRWWSIHIGDLGRFDVTIANGQIQVIDFAMFKGARQFAVDVGPNRPRRLYGWFDWSTGDPRLPPYVIVPLWCPAMVPLLLGIVGWWKQGRNPTDCRKCGYDRTGIAASARCPECGAIPRSMPAQNHRNSLR